MPDVAGDSSCATIASIIPAATINGTLETSGDHDWYRIVLSAGQQITVSLNGANANPLSDPYLIIRDELGNIVDSDDDSGDGTNSLLTFATAAGGTYYIDAGSYQGQTTGDYQLVVGNTPGLPRYSTDQIANYLVNGSWAAAGTTAHHWNVAIGGTLTVNITALNAAGQTLAREALAQWSDIIGIHFAEVASGGQITFDDNVLGQAYCNASYSGSIMSSASINIGSDWLDRYGTGLNTYSLQTYVHEIGHALGLGHAGNYNGTATYPDDATYRNDCWAMTVMSYFDPGENSYFRDEGFTYNYVVTPMLADIYAAWSIYGTPGATTHLGDTTYGFNCNAGDVFDATICPSARYTIVDDGGTDTFDCSGYSTNQTINLGAVTYSAGWMTFSNIGSGIGNVCITPGTVIENAIGGSGNDVIMGNQWNNVLDGGSGNDTASYVNTFGDVTVSLAAAGPQDTLYGGIDTLVSIENLTGGSHNDTLTGDAFANVLMGGPGSDILDGGAGDDRLVGGNGAELLIGGEGDDFIDGGDAYDTADYRSATEGVHVDISVSGPQDTGGGGVDTLVSVESVNGSAFDDVLTGNGNYNNLAGYDGNDVLSGGDLFDYLYGNAGNDYLDGGTGDDHLAGGAGDDIYVVDSSGDVVTESANEGTDEVRTGLAAFSLGTLADVEALTGTGTSDQQLTGNAAANRIDGGEGADTMAGGGGDDTYIVDNAADSVVENDDEGSDGVLSAVSFVLGSNVENLTLVGTASIDGTGNLLGNSMLGNDGSNVLDGMGGNDTMDGGAGDDKLFGGDGDDALDGGAGTDTASYGTASGAVVVNLAAGTASGAAGNDTLAGIENVNGSAFGDTLTGNALDNVLNGAAGADHMAGGQGNDRYVVDDAGDVVEESGGEGSGTDEVRTLVNFALGSNVENLTLIGIGNINGTGNALGNLMLGNAGDNILNGAGGADTMRGGAGNDTYFVNDAGDRAIEGSDSGSDTVRSSVTFTLGNNIETLILTGTAALNGTGNALANTLVGNSGNNVLNGAGGADILRGGQGDDTYIVNDSADRAVEGVSAGYDIVRSSVGYTIADNIEELVLTGTASIAGGGNNGDNRITGNSGGNFLVGRNGNDILIGLSGDDRLAGGNGADNLNGGSGNDWVEGGTGQDLLTGGTGTDLFVFYDGDFGGSTGAAADRIRDFNHDEGDRIRLNFVDADSANGSGTNDAFTFIGTDAFHHTAGELRYAITNGNTYVTGDTDGDGLADFMIRLDGSHALVGGDFVL